ncbi:MAG: hypothetical protein AAGH76_08750 [Pseudomonadota bacterium]
MVRIHVGKNRAGDQLIATLDPIRKGLAIYDYDYFEEIEARIVSLSMADRKSRNFTRLFLGYATELEVTKSGDAELPDELVEAARVTDTRAIESLDRHLFWPSR